MRVKLTIVAWVRSEAVTVTLTGSEERKEGRQGEEAEGLVQGFSPALTV